MYRWRKVLIVIVGGLVTLCGQSAALAGPKDTQTVTAEGRAAGTDGNAMEQAKQDALRRAVEETCGTFINAQTRTKNYAAVYDKVLAQAGGYVTEFEVLSRRVEDGVSYCKVRAKVSKQSFEADWARLAHTLQSEGNPRCMIVVVEDNDADDQNPPTPSGVVQSILERFFMDKGVQLMDRGGADNARARDKEVASIINDVPKLAAMAASFKAEVVVSGKAEARRAGASVLESRTIYRWTATISIRAYHTDSAQLVMSNTYTMTVPTVHQDGFGDEALRKCAEENAGAILKDLGEAWRKRQNVQRTLQVTLENCSRADFKAFEEAAKKIEGVQAVRLRELVNNVCQVDIEWSYDLETLINGIEALHVGGASYAVTEQTHDRVTFKVAKL